MRISDWSSDVCSSDLRQNADEGAQGDADEGPDEIHGRDGDAEALEESLQGFHGLVPSAGKRTGGDRTPEHDHSSPFKKPARIPPGNRRPRDRKSTRLNSSH